MVIKVLELVPDCNSRSSGEIVGAAILSALQSNRKATISFVGVNDVPSVFVNSAFVPLLEHFSYDRLRQMLTVTNSTRQINDIIKRRLSFEANRVSTTTKMAG